MVAWSTAIHIISVFLAFGFTTGVGTLFGATARSGDVRTIRTAARVARPLFITGTIFLLIGILFGFGTASPAGFSLTSTWLLVTYVLVALLLILNGAVHAPWSARLAKAATASPDDQPSPGLLAIVNDPVSAIAGPVGLVLWLAIIVMMVVKPF